MCRVVVVLLSCRCRVVLGDHIVSCRYRVVFVVTMQIDSDDRLIPDLDSALSWLPANSASNVSSSSSDPD